MELEPTGVAIYHVVLLAPHILGRGLFCALQVESRYPTTNVGAYNFGQAPDACFSISTSSNHDFHVVCHFLRRIAMFMRSSIFPALQVILRRSFMFLSVLGWSRVLFVSCEYDGQQDLGDITSTYCMFLF